MDAKSDPPKDTLAARGEDVESDISQDPLLTQGKEIEAVLQRAVNQALLAHKRAGNTIAAWKGGKVKLIPPGEIQVEEVLDVKQTPFEQTIFLTGFPGFIASRLVERLAVEGARFLLHVQPAFMVRAREEMIRIAEKTGTSASRFLLIEGDITQPKLGLSPAELEIAQNETTALFHIAAIYDLAVPRGVAIRVNVEGTRNVNSFARTLANLRRYHYVSTCYVAGLRTGVILETELRHEAGFRNYYEESKHLAELEVDALKSELPITIYRPSVICGDSRTGETAKHDGIYYLIHYLRMRPNLLSLMNVGNREEPFNVVPVDFVIEAMATLAKDERGVGATVHLTDPEPLTTHDVFETLARTLTGHGSRVSIPSPLVRMTLSLPLSQKVTGLPRVGIPYFFINQTYDTTQAQALLEPHGIRCPPFSSYAGALVDFVAQHPTLLEELPGATASFTLGYT